MKKKEPTLNRAYQIVTGIAAVVFIISCIEAIMFTLSIRASGGNVHSWSVWYMVSQLLPGVVFAIIWYVSRGSRWERLYQAAMLTIATTLLASTLMTIVMMLVWPFVFTLVNEASSMIVLNGTPFILYMLTVVVLAALLKRHVDVKRALRYVAVVLMVALCVFFVTNVVQTVYFAISQYPDNQNLSAYVSSFVGYGVVAILFALTWILEKKRGSKHSLLVAANVTTMGMLALYSVSYAAGLFTSSQANQWVIATLVTACCLLAIIGYSWLYKNLRVLA